MATKKIVKKSAPAKKAPAKKVLPKKVLPKKAGPRPPKDESRKPLNDIGDRWVKTNDTIYSTFQFPRGNRMTKQERQREPFKSASAWKEFKNTRRKER